MRAAENETSTAWNPVLSPIEKGVAREDGQLLMLPSERRRPVPFPALRATQ